jgi:phosphate transport system substrate-binding protein
VTTLSQAYQEQNPAAKIALEIRETNTTTWEVVGQTSSFFISHHLAPNSPVWAAPLAQDGLVLITHPDNPVMALTPDDIRRLYQGVIINWQEVGGANVPIVLFSREEGSSLRAEFDRLVMGQRRISPNARLIPSSAAAIESVIATPGALAYIAFSQLPATVNAVAIHHISPTRQTIADQLYPLRMTVFIIGQNEPSSDEQVFITWLQAPVGQAIIGQTYIPQVR